MGLLLVGLAVGLVIVAVSAIVSRMNSWKIGVWLVAGLLAALGMVVAWAWVSVVYEAAEVIAGRRPPLVRVTSPSVRTPSIPTPPTFLDFPGATIPVTPWSPPTIPRTPSMLDDFRTTVPEIPQFTTTLAPSGG